MSNAVQQQSRVLLPPAEPILVMLGSNDPDQLKMLDEHLRNAAKSLDIRSNALWTEVADGRAFLRSTLDLLPNGRRNVRFCFARPQATVEQLLRSALLSSDLECLGQELNRFDGRSLLVSYQVRYQPIVSLQDRSVIGFESLIRGKDENADLSAESLIRNAIAADRLGELDELCRSMAIQGVGSWLGESLLFLNVLAPDGAFDERAVMATIDLAREVGLAPDQLVLEAVERNRYESLSEAKEQLERFREHGVRIAVDDVGDGYSSLRTVASFKPDIVKIAGCFANELGQPQGRAIVRAIVQLAHETGAWVVAENLETEEQAEQAAGLGIDWGQGHYFGVPALP